MQAEKLESCLVEVFYDLAFASRSTGTSAAVVFEIVTCQNNMVDFDEGGSTGGYGLRATD